MKSITTLLFSSLLFFGGLAAQDLEGNNEATAPKFSAGISLGVNLSEVNNNYLAFPLTQLDFNEFTRHLNVNEYLNIHFLYHIDSEYGIESGIIYDKRTIHLSGTTDVTAAGINFDGRKVDATYNYEYFTLPILFKKTVGENKFKATVHAGPYLAFLQSASFTIVDYTIVEKHGGGFEEVTQSHALTIKDVSRKFNAGVLLKAGVEFKASDLITPFLQGFYSRSLSRVDDLHSSFPNEVNSDARHSSFGASVGVYFRMK